MNTHIRYRTALFILTHKTYLLPDRLALPLLRWAFNQVHFVP